MHYGVRFVEEATILCQDFLFFRKPWTFYQILALQLYSYWVENVALLFLFVIAEPFFSNAISFRNRLVIGNREKVGGNA